MSQSDNISIKGITCPACGSHDTIFIGSGGYLTCSWVECPEPELHAAIQQAINRKLEDVSYQWLADQIYKKGYDDGYERSSVYENS